MGADESKSSTAGRLEKIKVGGLLTDAQWQQLAKRYFATCVMTNIALWLVIGSHDYWNRFVPLALAMDLILYLITIAVHHDQILTVGQFHEEMQRKMALANPGFIINETCDGKEMAISSEEDENGGDITGEKLMAVRESRGRELAGRIDKVANRDDDDIYPLATAFVSMKASCSAANDALDIARELMRIGVYDNLEQQHEWTSTVATAIATKKRMGRAILLLRAVPIVQAQLSTMYAAHGMAVAKEARAAARSAEASARSANTFAILRLLSKR